MEKTKLFLRFPLNIQNFAEGGGNNGQDPTKSNGNDQISKEDYDKLKSQFDKTSSELAKMKKEAKDKMTEDEKKAEEQKAKDDRLAELELQVLTSNMTNELLDSGLEKDSVSKIVETYKKGDMVALCKTISAEVKKLTEKVEADAKQKFQQSQTIPLVGGDGKPVNPFVQSRIDKQKNNEKNTAFEYFRNKQ